MAPSNTMTTDEIRSALRTNGRVVVPIPEGKTPDSVRAQIRGIALYSGMKVSTHKHGDEIHAFVTKVYRPLSEL